MKTLLKSLMVTMLLTAGAAGISVATTPAANAYEVVQRTTVVHEGPGYRHPAYHRAYHHGYYRHGYAHHCVRRVFYRHGYRHVVRRCA